MLTSVHISSMWVWTHAPNCHLRSSKQWLSISFLRVWTPLSSMLHSLGSSIVSLLLELWFFLKEILLYSFRSGSIRQRVCAHLNPDWLDFYAASGHWYLVMSDMMKTPSVIPPGHVQALTFCPRCSLLLFLYIYFKQKPMLRYRAHGTLFYSWRKVSMYGKPDLKLPLKAYAGSLLKELYPFFQKYNIPFSFRDERWLPEDMGLDSIAC